MSVAAIPCLRRLMLDASGRAVPESPIPVPDGGATSHGEQQGSMERPDHPANCFSRKGGGHQLHHSKLPMATDQLIHAVCAESQQHLKQ